VSKQEGEVAKGGLTSHVDCKREGGATEVSTKKKNNNDEIKYCTMQNLTTPLLNNDNEK
jgi:hypothetical protein